MCDTTLLLEAAKLYPNGVKFLSLFDFRVFTSPGTFHISNGRVYITDKEVGCIYANGNWATTVTPKSIEGI